MAPPTGRREASKQATRAALTAAAQRLFAEHSFEATTVADIAAAANVTQRTFYRYFDGKEDLVAEEYRAWLAALRDAIVARPAHEPPLTAVQHAMISVGAPAPVWPFRDRPFAGLRQSAPRPLLRFETAITSAILARLGAGEETAGTPPDAGQFQAEVTARVAVAAFRSAVIRIRELRKGGETDPPAAGQLLGDAFTVIRGL
jgi:AcrR family transcriptional regulator